MHLQHQLSTEGRQRALEHTAEHLFSIHLHSQLAKMPWEGTAAAHRWEACSPWLPKPAGPFAAPQEHSNSLREGPAQPHNALSCRMESRDTAGTEQADLARDALIPTTNLR